MRIFLPAASVLGVLALSIMGFDSAHAAASPEEQCAPLKSNSAAYEQCIDSVRHAQGLASSTPQPTPSAGPVDSPSDSQEASRASQRGQMAIAIGIGISVAVLAIGFSIWRTIRRSRSYPVDEVTALLATLIPPEVSESNPNAVAIPIPRAGGKATGKLMALSVLVAILTILAGLAIAATGNSEKIWIVPIVLLPFGVGYAWWVTRTAIKSSDEWLAPLGLQVTKTPSAIVGPNPAGLAGGNLLRPYVLGPSVMEGRRYGREVTITQESAGVGGVSLRILVQGRAPTANCRGERDAWSGSIPEGAAGEVIRAARVGPGSVTIAGDGQGLVLIRQISQREILSKEGYGLIVRDLDLVESIMNAEGW